jgi:CHAT domain-containing protein
LQGHRILNAQFTRAALDRELLLGYPVVHVASHFQFLPGDETRSFLLLGDGRQLTLAELKAADTIFSGVDLLTLSACSTGLGSSETADGSEVESFGVLAQRKGAKAVVASLWSVADESTAVLMREFYWARQRNPHLTKLGALREAQLSLLHGDWRASASRGVSIGQGRRGSAPDRRNDSASIWSHPYYWAPFFLMGNWL